MKKKYIKPMIVVEKIMERAYMDLPDGRRYESIVFQPKGVVNMEALEKIEIK